MSSFPQNVKDIFRGKRGTSTALVLIVYHTDSILSPFLNFVPFLSIVLDDDTPNEKI